MTTTPRAGAVSQVGVGGTSVIAVIAVPAGMGGGFVTNPYTALDQGLSQAEPLYIDITGAPATTSGNSTTFALQPGQTFNMVAGQVTGVSANAASTGHKFSVIWWS